MNGRPRSCGRVPTTSRMTLTSSGAYFDGRPDALPRSQRREAAGIEPPNQRSHILFVEIQPPGNGSRPHPLPREGDDLCAPQIRRRLRRLQDPSQPPTLLRASVLEHTDTREPPLALSLSVLDTKGA